MAYTTPKTWVAGEYPTATQFNTHLRDNMSFLANPPACRVHNSAAISIPEVTDTALTFNSERWDTDGMHSTAAATSRITIVTAGLYLITASIRMEAAADWDNVVLHIRLGGTTHIATQGFAATDTSEVVDLSVTTVYKLAATNYLEAVVWHNNGANAARNVLAVGNYSPEFGATWIGLG